MVRVRLVLATVSTAVIDCVREIDGLRLEHGGPQLLVLRHIEMRQPIKITIS